MSSPDPQHPTRRQFAKAAALTAVSAQRILGANDRVRLGFIGIGNRGGSLLSATREFAGYDSSLTAGGLAWLLQSAIDVVPSLREAPVMEQWVGFRPLSADGVPLIGPAAVRGLYYITGHGPTGIGPAPASARLLAALIEGAAPPVPAAPYDPLRFRSASET